MFPLIVMEVLKMPTPRCRGLDYLGVWVASTGRREPSAQPWGLRHMPSTLSPLEAPKITEIQHLVLGIFGLLLRQIELLPAQSGSDAGIHKHEHVEHCPCFFFECIKYNFMSISGSGINHLSPHSIFSSSRLSKR